MTTEQSKPGDAYQVVRDELVASLRNLDDAAAAVTVPACPEWTVKDVAAHLVGLNADWLADVQGGLGTDEATTRQVSVRAPANLGEILDEWTSLSDAIHDRMTANETMATALLADLVIHVYDLAEVLDQPRTQAEAATPRSAHRYISLLQERVADRCQVALTVELSDGTSWPAAAGTTPVSVRTDPHSFLRGVTGRLRRSQVEAFDWSADPTEILDHAWSQYGPFRA